MKGKNLTFGVVAWHDNEGTVDASVVQILKNAGGEQLLWIRHLRCFR